MNKDIEHVMNKFGLSDRYREVVIELLGTWEADHIQGEQIEEMAYLFEDEGLI